MPDFDRTGVFATPEEVEVMKQPVPAIVIGGHMPPSPLQRCHSYALSHGLPEFAGYYGCDFANGEFIKPT